jgi:16S rRNA processing protein RimM
MKIVTDYPERVLRDLSHVYVGRDPDQPAARYELQSARFHQTYILLQLKGLNDRDEVDALRGYYVMVDLDHAVPLDEDEFYLYELIGLTVRTEDGVELGKIVEVMETGANDVYIINSPAYGQLLVPAHDQTLVEIDLENQYVIMDLPDGILPDQTSQSADGN